MKKVLLNFICLLSLILFSSNVYASSAKIDLVGNKNFTKEITLNLQVNNLVDFNGSCNGLCGLVANLNYDHDKLELISINALNGFDLAEGNKIVLYKSTGVNNKTNILTMKFKNKKLANNEPTTIELANIVVSDGDKDINVNNTKKTITYINYLKPTNPNTENNSNNGEEKKKSNNNYLSSITLSNGNIKFDKDILTYNITLDYNISSIEVKAIADSNLATITGNGNYVLNVGENTIKITVKAEDNSEKIYTLNVTRKENNIANDYENKPNKSNKLIISIIITTLILVMGIIAFIICKKRKKDSR